MAKKEFEIAAIPHTIYRLYNDLYLDCISYSVIS